MKVQHLVIDLQILKLGQKLAITSLFNEQQRLSFQLNRQIGGRLDKLWRLLFSSKKIVHPLHVAIYSSMSPNILSYVSNNISLMLEIYSWKDSLGFICSCSHSHAHKIASLDMAQCYSSHKLLWIACVLLGPFDQKWTLVALETMHGHKEIPSLQLWFFSWWVLQHSPSSMNVVPFLTLKP